MAIGDVTDISYYLYNAKERVYNLEDELEWGYEPNAYQKTQNGGIGWIAVANRQVIADLIEVVQWVIYGHTTPANYWKWVSAFWDLYTAENGVTWKAICEAWAYNDFEGKEWTIACIDRMRTLMWDEPFSIQWAASPKAPRE